MYLHFRYVDQGRCGWLYIDAAILPVLYVDGGESLHRRQIIVVSRARVNPRSSHRLNTRVGSPKKQETDANRNASSTIDWIACLPHVYQSFSPRGRFEGASRWLCSTTAVAPFFSLIPTKQRKKVGVSERVGCLHLVERSTFVQGTLKRCVWVILAPPLPS